MSQSSEPVVHICDVETLEGTKEYVTLLTPDVFFAQGLARESIVGMLLRPLGPGESITPEIFVPNRVFVDFMHDVISRYFPQQPDCLADAERLGDGWIYIIDQRTPTPQGPVPPEDIIGAIQVVEGKVVPASYRPNHKHMILSPRGFFQLGQGLRECLLRELAARNAKCMAKEENR